MIDATCFKFDNLKPRNKVFWGIFLTVLMALAVFELRSALIRGSGAGATFTSPEDQYTSVGRDSIDDGSTVGRNSSSTIHTNDRGDSIDVVSTIGRNSSSPMRTDDALAPTMLPSAISPPANPTTIFALPSTMQPCPPLFRKTSLPTSAAAPSLPPLSPSSSSPMMRTYQLRQGQTRQPAHNS